MLVYRAGIFVDSSIVYGERTAYHRISIANLGPISSWIVFSSQIVGGNAVYQSSSGPTDQWLSDLVRIPRFVAAQRQLLELWKPIDLTRGARNRVLTACLLNVDADEIDLSPLAPHSNSQMTVELSVRGGSGRPVA